MTKAMAALVVTVLALPAGVYAQASAVQVPGVNVPALVPQQATPPGMFEATVVIGKDAIRLGSFPNAKACLARLEAAASSDDMRQAIASAQPLQLGCVAIRP